MKIIMQLACLVVLCVGWWSVPAHAVECGADGSECVQIENPIKGVTTVPQLVGTLIKGALGVIGAITLLMFVWGGFQWLIAAGNAEKVQQGTQTMVWAAIGVIIVFSSYFIIDQLTNLLKK